MKTTDLTSLSPATLAALARVTKAAAAKTRPELEPGKYKIAETVSLDLSALVNVGEDYEQEFVNKAKPWNIVVALLEEANKRLAAAGFAGIDLERIVVVAETADPDLATEAKEKADEQVKKLKAPTKKKANGKVTIKAKATLPAVTEPEAPKAKASIFSGPAQI
jgi:hypothetical protein